MKVAILAGGRGTRFAEETEVRPKPLIAIGGRPILWHIMKYYAHHGFNDFVIALGYKGDMVKRYFIDACTLSGNVRVDFAAQRVHSDGGDAPDWTVELVETGEGTMTGGRLKRLAPHLDDGPFMLTWADGVCDVDLHALLAFHRGHGRLATLTAVRPPPRFGHVGLAEDGQTVATFVEKPADGGDWINGAFFVLEPGVLQYIDGDDTVWEEGPLPRLAADGQLKAYRHAGFWQCMDTVRDRERLEGLWASGAAPWKAW